MNSFLSKSKVTKYDIWEPVQAKKDWQEKKRGLSSSSKNFERDTYKGGRGALTHGENNSHN